MKSASSDDSGVYLCILEHRGVRTIIQVVAVTVVTSDPTITVRATRQLILQCQAFTLSYIFGELNQVWIHDGLIWKDYGIASLGVVRCILTLTYCTYFKQIFCNNTLR